MNLFSSTRRFATIVLLAPLALVPCAAAHAFGSPGHDISHQTTTLGSGDSSTGTSDIFSGGPGVNVHGGSDTNVTVNGGTYTGGTPGGNGIDVSDSGTTVTINGGSFVGSNGYYGGSAVSVTNGATVNVNGGTFQSGTGMGTGSNGYDFLLNGGTVNVYGSFVGGSQTITSGSGSFDGILQNNVGPDATYTYSIVTNGNSGTLNLVDNGGVLATPEPSGFTSCTVLTVLGAGGILLGLRKRRNNAV